jgi:extracellular factor (EF) 3-hydroxypalmitic acid methyl ester biosynthesis protein
MSQRKLKDSDDNTVVELKRKRVRQDRIEIPDLRSRMKIKDDSFEIINISAFGVGIISEKEFTLNTFIENADILIENIPVVSTDLKCVRSEKTHDGNYRIGFEVMTHQISVEAVTAITEALRLRQDIDARLSRYSHLPEKFRIEVYEMRELLDLIESKIKEFEGSKNFLSKNDKDIFENVVITAFSNPIFECIKDGNLRLKEILSGATKDQLQFGYDFFREQLKHFLYQSPFADRSYRKPLNYPGDYEMMRLIYRDEAYGTTLFGRCMEKALQMFPEPGAVRNRATYLADKIGSTLMKNKDNENINILSVACGPAHEWSHVLSKWKSDIPKNLTISLLDQDEAALKAAQRSIYEIAKKHGVKVNLDLINTPIKRIIVEGLHDTTFDLIYSAGLFDYFTDPVASRAGKTLFDALKSGGTLIIGNFDIQTPNQFGMRTVFDWDLIYRSREDLLRLYSIPNSEITIEEEMNKINLFCQIKKGPLTG